VTIQNWLALGLLIVAILVTVPLLGGYMAKVYDPSLGRPRGERGRGWRKGSRARQSSDGSA